MIVQKKTTLIFSATDLLEFMKRNLRNERQVNVDSIRFDVVNGSNGVPRVAGIILEGTEETDDSK